MKSALAMWADATTSRVSQLQFLLAGVGVVGVVMAVLGAFYWCESSVAIVGSVGVTAAAGAVAAALPVTGAVARIAAAIAAGSVVGTAALGLTFLALGLSSCVEVG